MADHPASSSEGNHNLFGELFGIDEDDSLLNDDSELDGEIRAEDSDTESENHFAYSVEGGPSTGMYFLNVDDLFKFYKEFLRLKGFGVFKKSAAKCNGEYRKYVTLSCDKGRKPQARGLSKKLNYPTKVNAILRDNGMWEVSSVVSTHNHELFPDMSRLMSAHRAVKNNIRRRLEMQDLAGIRPSKSIRLVQYEAGGPDKMSCLAKDYRNHIDRTRRLLRGEGDADSMEKLFATMQVNDPGFFYSIDLDEEFRLANVLWVHPRCKAAYREFHDVISFDTTYLVNRYKLPFATVVGVNHHGQSILMGCALLTREDADTFKWLFKTWLYAIGDIHPSCILTDQCEGIRKAIREVMPNTRHRFYIWHILAKLPEKFKHIAEFGNARNDFKGLVYDSLTAEFFEENWQAFLTKYDLQGNQWLMKLYEEREFWVPVYLKDSFWAGMLSTQRSEGMHAYFDGFILPTSTLKKFVEQYELAIRDKIDKECLADYKSKNKVSKCHFHFQWEKQFQQVFTHEMFHKVQNQIKRMVYCHIVDTPDRTMHNLNDVSEPKMFKIQERCLVNNWYHREFVYDVEYVEDGQHFSCTCNSFQSTGIICCHIMKILDYKSISHVNERYLFARWRKDIQRAHTSIFPQGWYPQLSAQHQKFKELEIIFHEAADQALQCNKHEMFLHRLKKLRAEMSGEVFPQTAPDSIPNHNDVGVDNNNNFNDGSHIHVLDPPIARTRGRPRTNRLRSVGQTIRRPRATRNPDRSTQPSGRNLNTNVSPLAQSASNIPSRSHFTPNSNLTQANNVRQDLDRSGWLTL